MRATLYNAQQGHTAYVALWPQIKSHLTVKECAELIEYVQAWGTEQGVRFTAPEWMEVA